jgi:hypothetical protein
MAAASTEDRRREKRDHLPENDGRLDQSCLRPCDKIDPSTKTGTVEGRTKKDPNPPNRHPSAIVPEVLHGSVDCPPPSGRLTNYDRRSERNSLTHPALVEERATRKPANVARNLHPPRKLDRFDRTTFPSRNTCPIEKYPSKREKILLIKTATNPPPRLHHPLRHHSTTP